MRRCTNLAVTARAARWCPGRLDEQDLASSTRPRIPATLTTAGIPNSPSTMAPSESYPPLFITSADAFKNSGVQPGAVEEGDRISPAPRIPKS